MKFIQIFLLTLFFTTWTSAKDYFITPNGGGPKDGSSWNNAARGTTISTFINSILKPGDNLYIGSGTYDSKIDIKLSGTKDAPISIRGFDTGDGLPVFTGTWSENDPGSSNGSWSAVTFDGQSHIVISDLIITQWMYGVHSGKNSSSNIQLSNLDIHHNREGIYLNNVHLSFVKSCTIKMYTKRGIRFDGDVNEVIIENVLTDHNNGDDTWPQEWPFGFMVEEKPNNHTISFLSCSSFNNTQKRSGSDYWNGDGFCAEKTAYELRYINCQSYDNADGGWDDKSLAPYLENCIAFGNKRNFRFWNVAGSATEPALMKNCIGGYAQSLGGSGSQCGVWTRGFVKIENSTFHNNKSYAISAETDGSSYTVTVDNSILSATDVLGNFSPNNLTKAESGATITLTSCEKYVTDKTGRDPQYIADEPAWQGEPENAYNSQTFGPATGYWMGESAVTDRVVLPAAFELYGNYPNPFNPATTIPYILHHNAHIKLHIYNAKGQLVTTLVDEFQRVGSYSIQFHATNLSSGQYFYQLTAGNFSAVHSMSLLR